MKVDIKDDALGSIVVECLLDQRQQLKAEIEKNNILGRGRIFSVDLDEDNDEILTLITSMKRVIKYYGGSCEG